MSTSNSSDGLCAMCSSPGTLACAGCHSIRDCAKACQRADWPLHKLLCSTFKDFTNDNRPIEDRVIYERAIYFSDTEDTPRWIWLAFSDRDEQGFATADFNHSPAEQHMEFLRAFRTNKVLARSLSEHIVLTGVPGVLSLPQNLAKLSPAETSSLHQDYNAAEEN